MANSEKKKIILNAAWMIFDKVFMLILNLFVTVKIANHYGTMGYGTYQYAASVVALFEILVTFVDGRVVKKRYSGGKADDIVFTATMSRALFSVLSLLIGSVYIALVNSDTAFTVMFIILLTNSIITNLRFGMANRFEYVLQSRKIVLASDAAACVATLLQLVAVRRDWTIVAISIIALVSSIINLSILVGQYFFQFGNIFRGKFDKDLLNGLVRESLPLAVAASCATIYTRCDSVMLGAMMSASEVGIYAISTKLITIVQIAIGPIRESVYPKLIHMYYNDRKAYEVLYIKISSIMTWIYIVGVVFSFLVLPFAFRFLNEEYAAALPVYRIHVLGTFFMYNAALRAGHYTIIGRGSVLTYSQIVSVVANILMNYVGISLWGMYGAALATAVTQGISLLISNLFFKEDGKRVFMWQLKAMNPMNIFKTI